MLRHGERTGEEVWAPRPAVPLLPEVYLPAAEAAAAAASAQEADPLENGWKAAWMDEEDGVAGDGSAARAGALTMGSTKASTR